MTKTVQRQIYAVLVVFALTIVGFPPAPAAAQVSTGSIAGTVLDSTGQLVPGAQVTIRNVNRNTSTTFVTDQNGAYTALFLVPGTYEVQVTLQGFKSWVRSDLVLQVNDRLRIDASLEVGGIEETTTVLASSPVVRTDSSEVGTVIEETAIKELPLNGRNFATLGLPRARHHAWAGRRESVRRQHVQPTGGLQLQRPGPPGQLQRLAR